ncbi:neutral zinc metallopeptidase [Actinomyces sp. B33]|uniref:KPN_02809 family neutral zinc metallopeptidase n=1 Tax=Actinomyces sp. B33 TaxID=2942131 RepID=UPI00233FD2E8|nr:neutral zinc metallopeptidase [Actinomyces sp. B33]MDC4233382.1 neutral zinc metallopeptidase [Actinomyces sp. B33]
MSFNEGVRSDSSRVRSSGRTAAGIGGGSILTVLAVVLISQFTGIDLTGLLSAAPQGSSSAGPGVDLSECTTGRAANERTECRMVTTADSLDVVWQEQLAAQSSTGYQAPGFQIFQDAVSTGCGSATSATGPFYCPADATVYLDLGFFQQMESDFGAANAPLAQEYVVAHEWGHHIQNLHGVFSTHDTREQGEQGAGVRSELQADCYAGVWMNWASRTIDPDSGVPFLVEPTEAQIADALQTAQAIGDDRLQERYQGASNADTWTHGSAQQRQKWLLTGLESGSIASCDTWSAPTV